MSHDSGAHCHCVAAHRPPVLELHRHHVHPLYLGGPDTEANLVWVCATTHGNVHEILRQMVKAGRVLSRGECAALQGGRQVPGYSYELARTGMLRYLAGR
jgi:5-methylcytosine-specific restriction endonuclease McrA